MEIASPSYDDWVKCIAKIKEIRAKYDGEIPSSRSANEEEVADAELLRSLESTSHGIIISATELCRSNLRAMFGLNCEDIKRVSQKKGWTRTRRQDSRRDARGQHDANAESGRSAGDDR